MRAKEFLTERLSTTVFHYTSLKNTESILRDQKFVLRASNRNSMDHFMSGGSVDDDDISLGRKKQYPYFLSTTRTRHGSYHSNLGEGGALFELDGNWFNNHYPSIPVNYNIDDDERSGEAEDRVFSASPNIPLNGVRALHVLGPGDDKERNRVLRILKLAEKSNIPAYAYRSWNAWLNFDKRNRVDLANFNRMFPAGK